MSLSIIFGCIYWLFLFMTCGLFVIANEILNFENPCFCMMNCKIILNLLLVICKCGWAVQILFFLPWILSFMLISICGASILVSESKWIQFPIPLGKTEPWIPLSSSSFIFSLIFFQLLLFQVWVLKREKKKENQNKKDLQDHLRVFFISFAYGPRPDQSLLQLYVAAAHS